MTMHNMNDGAVFPETIGTAYWAVSAITDTRVSGKLQLGHQCLHRLLEHLTWLQARSQLAWGRHDDYVG